MSDAAQPLYDCRGLVKRRRTGEADFELRIPALRIRAGELIVLRGPSGCGKSTLLDLLALALNPDDGERFSFQPRDGSSVEVLGAWRADADDLLGRLRREHIGYVLQTGGLLPFLTVRENIALPLRLRGHAREGAVEQLAAKLDILPHLAKHPGQLSIGERQRVAIARALAHEPTLVLADEPTASLDPVNAVRIRDLLVDLVRQSGAAAVIATHEWSQDDLPGARFLQHRLERAGNAVRSYFWE